MSTDAPSCRKLIAEIERLEDAAENGLYSDGNEGFVEAIGAAREAFARAQHVVHQACLCEGVTWHRNALTGFAEELKLLDRLITTTATRLHHYPDEIAEIAKAIADAETAVAEASDVVEQLAIPPEWPCY